MIVAIFGPPGAGKGTYSKIIANDFLIPHISLGDLIREEIRNKTEIGLSIKEVTESGGFAPDEITFNLLKKRISQSDCKEGFILDGFPRTLKQAKLIDFKLDYIFNIVVDKELLIKRLSLRRMCKCGAVYNLLTHKPKLNNICDNCASTLYTREDDKEEVIRKRFDIYLSETTPVLNYYKKNIYNINGNGDINSVIKQIKKVIV